MMANHKMPESKSNVNFNEIFSCNLCDKPFQNFENLKQHPIECLMDQHSLLDPSPKKPSGEEEDCDEYLNARKEHDKVSTNSLMH